jgi:predicted transcriptional regulator
MEEIELNLPAVIELDTPPPEGMPERVQQVMCLQACGFSQASIANLLGVTRQAINDMITRYDPNKRFTMTVSERKRFLAKLWEAKAGEALLHITPEKLAASRAGALAGIARTASLMMDKFTPPDQPERDPQALIKRLSPALSETSG